MKKIQTSKGLLKVSFQHLLPRISEEGDFMNREDAGTYCSISKIEYGESKTDVTEEVVAQGKSIIHDVDKLNFKKEKGRIISLKRALDSLYPSKRHKEERGKVWLAYRSR